MDSRDLQNEAMSVWERMKAIRDHAESENRDLTDEENTHYQETKTDYLALVNRIKRAQYEENTPMASDVEQQQWNLRRDREAGPPASEEENSDRNSRAYHQAFLDYMSAPSAKMVPMESMQILSTGIKASMFSESEQKRLRTALTPSQYQAAMGVGSQTGGGFWVPDAMMQRIEKALLWYGGMNEFAETIDTDDGADLPWPVYDDTSNVGRRLAENTAATQTDLSVGVRVLKAHMYTSDEVLISLQLIQDRPDLAEGIIADALGERIARITNTEFTTYAGGDGPQGLINATTAGVTAAATGAVTPDELRNLKYSVNRAYRERPKAAFMMNDQTLRDVLGLKDSEGDYLFVPDPRLGAEPTLWGGRVIVNNDIPTMATGVVSIEYGDGGSYKIRRVRGFTLLRMEVRYAPNLQVSFLGFARYDGGYINAGQNPIKHLVHP